MYNHNKAQQSKNRVHISWDILYSSVNRLSIDLDRVFSPIRCQAIIYTNACLLSIERMNKLQWFLNLNHIGFSYENASDYIVCEMAFCPGAYELRAKFVGTRLE